jgi:hypothetical protein
VSGRPPLYIHAGLVRTGSTTLQGSLFPRHSGLNYLGLPGTDHRVRQLCRNLIFEDSLFYDLEKEQRLAAKILDDVSDDRPILLSDEAFTWTKGTDRLAICKRLQGLLNPDKVMLVLRNQIDAVQSLYWMEALKTRERNNRTPELNDWVRSMATSYEPRGIHCYLYKSLVDQYCDVFGRDKVGIFLFEDLAADQSKFYGEICDFLEIDAGEGAEIGRAKAHHNRNISTRRLLAWYGFRKRFLPGVSLSALVPPMIRSWIKLALESGPRAESQLTEESLALLNDFFASDNEALVQAYQIPLEAKGYPSVSKQ